MNILCSRLHLALSLELYQTVSVTANYIWPANLTMQPGDFPRGGKEARVYPSKIAMYPTDRYITNKLLVTVFFSQISH